MNSKNKFLGKNIVIFSIGMLVPKIITVILIPIITKYTSNEEYGIAKLLIVTVSLIMPLLSLDIQEAVLRFAMDKNENSKKIFSAGIGIVLCSEIFLVIALLMLFSINLFEIKIQYIIFISICYLFRSIKYDFYNFLQDNK